MTNTTRLEPLAPERARQLFDMMHDVQEDDFRALALDDMGHVVGIVGADDPVAQHLLHDLDVHA